MLIAALPDAETAANFATLMFSMALTFNGVFQAPSALPGFWIFMYRVSPLTCKLMFHSRLHSYLVLTISRYGVSYSFYWTLGSFSYVRNQ